MFRRVLTFLLATLCPSLAALELPAGSLSLGNPDVVMTTLLGDNAQDHLGLGVAGGGDLDGDGHLDLVVAAPGAGRVYVIFAANRVLSPGLFPISALADLTLQVPRDPGLTSYALMMADFDHDGFDDLFIGTPQYDPNVSLFDTGRVFVLYGGGAWGAALDLTSTPPPPGVLVISSDIPRGRLGYTFAGGVDVNRDGGLDILITSPGLSTETPTPGRALLIYGRTPDLRPTGVVTLPDLIGPMGEEFGGIQLSGPPGTDFGLSVSLTPPLHTSSLSGIFVGAPATTSGCGAVYGFIDDVWDAAYDTLSATWKLEGLCPAGRAFGLGSSLVGVDSVDEAPGMDLFVAAAETSTTGLLLSWLSPVNLSSGTVNVSSATGVSGDPNDFAGFLTIAADVDGTGPSSLDLLWAAPRANIGPGADKTKGGKVHLLYGGAGLLQPDLNGEVIDASFLGASGGENAGSAVASGGDLFGTGSQVVVIGAPLADTSGLDDRGRVYVVVPFDESDLDGDQISIRGGDCDDHTSSVYTSAAEVCNGLDDDCDLALDEGLTPPTWYQDQDGDGVGDSSHPVVSCEAPEGYVVEGGDCAPTDPNIYPGSPEILCDGVDQGCNGPGDDHPDGDQDTFDVCDANTPGDGDGKPADCDDQEAGLHPETLWYEDGDGDGQGDNNTTYQGCDPPSNFVLNGGDCAPTDTSIFVGAAETCNGVDDNCDGSVDEGVMLTVYDDLDADGWGDPGGKDEVCSVGAAQVQVAGDCDDEDPSVAPGEEEICDGIDNNCAGGVSDEQLDQDQDGYTTCTADPEEEDCDDGDPQIFPGADDVCDGEDNNCNDEIDEGEVTLVWADGDGDGEGDPGNSQTLYCEVPPAGWVTNSSDCDDTDAQISSHAEEITNGQDDNCNGEVDEGVAITSPTPEPSSNTPAGSSTAEETERVTDSELTPSDPTDPPVSPPSEDDNDEDGWSEVEGDCDDVRSDIYPGATERCDGVDNDCDTDIDEGFDQDGRGGADCTDFDGDGYSEQEFDCDDTDASVYPGADEKEDGRDNNCDGEVDEGGRLTDDDEDGYSELDGDCDDTQDSVNPGEVEVRGNPVDENCDGEAYDYDGDGWARDEGDCDDEEVARFPGAVEECGNDQDDNCNGAVDEACGDVMSFTGCSTALRPVDRGDMNLSFIIILCLVRVRSRSNRWPH